ncbi:IclR family transcriptional regulator [Peribacillus butanolivorans]|uniref:IclR family transcriptional regulator n=1 Tax=Peribacillus butanolivorans TaxID=421767 RepID=UPI0030C9F507
MRDIKVEPIRAVERTINILNCFSFEKTSLSTDEIIKETGLPKTTIFRLLWTLEKNGLIQYDLKEHSYRLGYKILEYGGIALEDVDIRQEAEPFLSELHKRTDYTILLGTKQDDTIQYLLRYDKGDFTSASYIGRRRILHYGALGILLMAYLPVEEAERILQNYPLDQLTPFTVIDEDKFVRRLEIIRNQGFYVDIDETFVGFTAISVPIFGTKGQVIAAVGISGASFKMEEEGIERITDLARNTCLNISRRMGYIHG